MLITVEERRARLAHRHRLLPTRRTDDVVALTEDVLALHSSDPVTVHLSAAVRMSAPDLGAVERALYTDRTLVRHHAMRRTLWVATPRTHRLMHAAATRRVAAAERRKAVRVLTESGVPDAAGWLDAASERVRAEVAAHGPLTARDLGRRLPDLAVPLRLTGAPGSQGAHTRVLVLLGFEAVLVRTRPVGSWVSGQYTWSTTEGWAPGAALDSGPEEDAAAAALLDAWLRRFGPATTTDVAWWFGWTLGLTRRALAASGAVPAEVATGGGSVTAAAWLSAADAPGRLDPDVEGRADADGVGDGGSWVALLPSLDPTVMGWKQRDWYLPPDAAHAAFDRNGNAGPTVWVDGRVVGAWHLDRRGAVLLHWFERVAPSAQDAARERAEVLERLVDRAYTVRFPGRIQAELRARAGD